MTDLQLQLLSIIGTTKVRITRDEEGYLSSFFNPSIPEEVVLADFNALFDAKCIQFGGPLNQPTVYITEDGRKALKRPYRGPDIRGNGNNKLHTALRKVQQT